MLACDLVNKSYTKGADLRDLIERHLYNTYFTVVDLLNDLKPSNLAELLSACDGLEPSYRKGSPWWKRSRASSTYHAQGNMLPRGKGNLPRGRLQN